MTDAGGTRNDIAWQSLFEKYHILDEIDSRGHFQINATAINEFREARLMTKFDDIEHLPSLFQKHSLSILPISRGDYVIARVDAYHRLESKDTKPIEHLEFPSYLESLDSQNITSEATAINCAYVAGILNHFLDEAELRLTVSGRMGSGQFEFQIDRRPATAEPLRLDVKNAQIEIDGGFEGFGSLSIIEAKNSVPYAFLVRQLYYPFRLWQNRISKPIRPIFFTYANRMFHLYEYRFNEIESYSSISLLKQQRYSLEPNDISIDDLEALLASTKWVFEPDAPFPQANSFERLINLCEQLYQSDSGSLTHEEITSAYNFVGRQTQYYTAAGIYLGLIDKAVRNEAIYTISERGRKLFQATYRERQLGFASAILEHTVFSQGLTYYLQKMALPSPDEIVHIMKDANLPNIDSESTYRRRAQTVRAWLQWIVELQSQHHK